MGRIWDPVYSTYYDVSPYEMSQYPNQEELLKRKRLLSKSLPPGGPLLSDEEYEKSDPTFTEMLGKTATGRAVGALEDIGRGAHELASKHIPGYAPAVKFLRTKPAEVFPAIQDVARWTEESPVGQVVGGGLNLRGPTAAIQLARVGHKAYKDITQDRPDELMLPEEKTPTLEEIVEQSPEVAAEVSKMPEMVDVLTAGAMGVSRLPFLPARAVRAAQLAEDALQVSEVASGAADIAEYDDPLGQGMGLARVAFGTLPIWSKNFRAFGGDVDAPSMDITKPSSGEVIPPAEVLRQGDEILPDTPAGRRRQAYRTLLSQEAELKRQANPLENKRWEEPLTPDEESLLDSIHEQLSINRQNQEMALDSIAMDADVEQYAINKSRQPIDIEARDVTSIADEQRLLDLQRRGEAEGLGETEIAELERLEKSIQTGGPADVPPLERVDVSPTDPVGIARQRTFNVIKSAFDRVKVRAAKLLDAPELADLELELVPGVEGSYRGKRAPLADVSVRGTIQIDPKALMEASAGLGSEEAILDHILHTYLAHEPAHARGLHIMPDSSGVYRKDDPFLPEGYRDRDIEIPEEFAAHVENQRFYDYRSGVDPEEAKFRVGMDILDHDPEVLAIRDLAKKSIQEQGLMGQMRGIEPDEISKAALLDELEAFVTKVTDDPERAKEILDELLGKEPVSKMMDDPGNANKILDDFLGKEPAPDDVSVTLKQQADDAMEMAKSEVVPVEKPPKPLEKPPEGQLSWDDWVKKNFPDGIPKNKRRAASKAYRDYRKNVVSAEPPKKGGPPPDLPPGKKPAPAEPKPKARYLSRMRQLFGRTLANIEYAMPKAGEAMKKFVNFWEAQAASTTYDLRQYKNAIRKLGKQLGTNSEDRVIRWLDGEAVEWADQKELKLALEIRRQMNNIWHHAELTGVAGELGPRGAYFPYYFEKDWAGPGQIGPTGRKARQAGGQKFGHLEKSRLGESKNFIRNLDVLEAYADSSWRRISEAMFLGKKHEKINKIVNSYDIRGKGALDPTRNQTKYIENAINAITQTKGSDPRLSRLRYALAVLDLPLAAIYQPAQATATAAIGGIGRSFKTAVRLFTDSKFRAAMVAGAERSGATRPDVVMEMAANAARTSILQGRLKGFMWGIPTLDKAARVHAFAVGEALHDAALKGSKSAQRTLKFLGFENFADPKTITPDQVGLRLSNKTQFRTGPAQKPLWASTEMGRFVWQYKHFAYQWGLMVKDLVTRGNVGALVKLVTIGGLVTGEVVGDLRAAIKMHDPFLDKDIPYDPDDPETYLHAIVDRSRRVPISHPLPRFLQNFFMIGGLGYWAEALAEPFARPYGLGQIGNVIPAARRPGELLEGAVQSVTQRDIDPLAKTLTQQVPVWGYDIARDAFSTSGRQPRKPRQRRRRR